MPDWPNKTTFTSTRAIGGRGKALRLQTCCYQNILALSCADPRPFAALKDDKAHVTLSGPGRLFASLALLCSCWFAESPTCSFHMCCDELQQNTLQLPVGDEIKGFILQRVSAWHASLAIQTPASTSVSRQWRRRGCSGMPRADMRDDAAMQPGQPVCVLGAPVHAAARTHGGPFRRR